MSLSKYKFDELSYVQSKLWNFALWWSLFIEIIQSLSQKSTEEISLMTLNSDTKLKKLISGFKYDMSNSVNFYATTQNSENFTSTGSFCPKYIRFELKIQRSYLVVSKMGWGIDWTFIKALKSLKNCTFMCLFYLKNIIFQLENFRRIMCHGTEGRWNL